MAASLPLFQSLDITAKVLSFLDLPSVAKFAQTCKIARDCTSDDVVWLGRIPPARGVTGAFDPASAGCSLKDRVKVWTSAINASSRSVDLRASPCLPFAEGMFAKVTQYAAPAVDRDVFRNVHLFNTCLFATPLLVCSRNPFPSFRQAQPFDWHKRQVIVADLGTRRMTRVRGRMTTSDIERASPAPFTSFEKLSRMEPHYPEGRFIEVIEHGDRNTIKTDTRMLGDFDRAVHQRLLELVRHRVLHGQVLERVMMDLLYLVQAMDTSRDKVDVDPERVTAVQCDPENWVLAQYLEANASSVVNTGEGEDVVVENTAFKPPAAAIVEEPGVYRAYALAHENWLLYEGNGNSHSLLMFCLEITPAGFSLTQEIVYRRGDSGECYS